MLILDIWGISYHAVVVFALGKNLLFKFGLRHCAIIDKHLDALSKWKSHMQTNTRPTDEDNCNVYQRNNDTGKSLPPPPLQAQFDQTQIDHANIMAQDYVHTGGR